MCCSIFPRSQRSAATEKENKMARSAGILLHLTSLPGRYGAGDLGPETIRTLNWMEECGFRWWQVLPLNPPAYGGSPYQAWSAFAGNPDLVSPELLAKDGLLTPEELAEDARSDLLRLGYQRFTPDGTYREFLEESSDWLEDAILFKVLHDREEASWTSWERELRERDGDALRAARRELSEELEFERFVQYQFFRQHNRFREEAEKRGIGLIGDIPIFVAHDSADVWAHPELYFLEADGEPSVVAGVPPDYFSKTGQRWGNPLYRWERMAEDRYSWWAKRLRSAFRLYDALRLDHFRGFESYWEIPASEKDATGGRWVSGPGVRFFEEMAKQIGPLPLLAEDLGDITPEVEALRESVYLPGMAVLQFGPSDPKSPHLPHNFEHSRRVVYTGTHDNDTTLGWWKGLSKEDRAFVRDYTGIPRLGARRASDVPKAMRRLAFGSIAEGAIIPMQDLLGLGSDARMNRPGKLKGTNWSWRMDRGDLDKIDPKEIRRELKVFRRLGEE